MILLLDNYDSFTYNLYQAIGQLYPDIEVIRNDEITRSIRKKNPAAIILSPGPGYPKDAGITIPVIQALSGKIPLLQRFAWDTRPSARLLAEPSSEPVS